ncbi:MAG: hypothetical protein FWE35_23640 [Streptosporangiales bacterium]|nr:hypothetical protein [Streptosporangiales bacterium]
MMTDTRPRRGSWTLVVLCGIAIFFLISLANGTLFVGTGGSLASTMVRGQNIFDALPWFAGAGVCFLIAVHFEHRARASVLPGRVTSGLERVRAPGTTLAGGIIILLSGIGFVSPALHLQAEANRSSATQAHGVLKDSRVDNVNAEGGCLSRTCVYRTLVTVALSRPVAGHSSTIVNVPYSVPYGPYEQGKSITVQVNPADPGYAELPGAPYATSGEAVSLDAITVIALALGVTGIVRGLRMRVSKPVVA